MQNKAMPIRKNGQISTNFAEVALTFIKYQPLHNG